MINSVKPMVYLNSKLDSNNIFSKVIKSILLFVSGASKIQLNNEEKVLLGAIISDIKTTMCSGQIIQNNGYLVEKVFHPGTDQYSIDITYMHDGQQCRESAISYTNNNIDDKLSRLSELEERFIIVDESHLFRNVEANYVADDYDIEEFEELPEQHFGEEYFNINNDADSNMKGHVPSEKASKESRKLINMMSERNLVETSGNFKDFGAGIATVRFENNAITQENCPNLKMLEENPDSLRVTLHYAGTTVIANCFGDGDSYDKWGKKHLKDPAVKKHLEYVKDVKEFDGIYADILEDNDKMYVLSGYDALRFLNEQANALAPVVRKNILSNKIIDNFEDKFIQELKSNVKERLVSQYGGDVNDDIELIFSNLSEKFYDSLRKLAIASKSDKLDGLIGTNTPYAYADFVMSPENGFNFLDKEILASIQERHKNDIKTNIPRWLKKAIDDEKKYFLQDLIDNIDDEKKKIKAQDPEYSEIEKRYNEIKNEINQLGEIFDDVTNIPKDPTKEEETFIKSAILDPRVKIIQDNITRLSITIRDAIMKKRYA